MTKRPEKFESAWVDPDDAPEWSDDAFARAEVAVGGEVVKPAEGTLTRRRGRPKLDAPKRQISVRLDADVLQGLRGLGAGWQGEMNRALREWLERRRA
ncbi:hypothetical protein CXZ10_20255 [Pleomorphomonas diazotrophica]|uniref:Uncharacterized protein n=1 Tax=Pleomorphomonas diazotrophica TaxID=1166257 RepID=A0A1I4V7L8_9HYPH|nr:BrnA antitoxin family protein [Pleomorphomonas diazotrophica]PKR87381.1 hypothetical protein CXZ10_20255 [Pleomorphomonas diazotrophica]SFM97163.1 Uncharacterized conserved protein, DUF4415 family [Pleomorphomonas diazotrophica]